jgi:CBS domain-containing protein
MLETEPAPSWVWPKATIEKDDRRGGTTMGLLGMITTAGIGYAAGVITARRKTTRSEDKATIDLREIREVMTAAPDAVRPADSLQGAAQLMRSNDIGDVLVEDDEGRLLGILTDRDIAIRATAEGSDPTTTTVGEVMRAGDIRRLPVVESGKAIGIVSLGDVSIETTPGSVLADISTASPDR